MGKTPPNFRLILVIFSLLLFSGSSFSAKKSSVPYFDRINYKLLYKKSINGIGRDSSGITFSPVTGTLFIIDDLGSISEVSKKGEKIRTIKLHGFGNAEGITHVSGNQFAFVEEDKGWLVTIEIGPDTTEIPFDKAAIYVVEPHSGEPGLEGITYVREEKAFYIVREEKPRKIYRVKITGNKMDLTHPFEAENLPMRHLTGVFKNNKISPHLFIVSEKPKRVSEVSLQGKVLSTFSVIQENYWGLLDGLTFDDEGTLYVVSEHNDINFYCYRPE